MACAIASTLQFSKQKPPPYPEMPFKEDDEQELAKDENWLKAQRLRAFNHFATILGNKKK